MNTDACKPVGEHADAPTVINGKPIPAPIWHPLPRDCDAPNCPANGYGPCRYCESLVSGER
jgi:hypothetical protein